MKKGSARDGFRLEQELQRLRPMVPAQQYEELEQDILHLAHMRMRQMEKDAQSRALEKQNSEEEGPKIKQIPEYDPDAECSSLSFTIPAWIGSLYRFAAMANVGEASIQARQRLSAALENLGKAIQMLEERIKENEI